MTPSGGTIPVDVPVQIAQRPTAQVAEHREIVFDVEGLSVVYGASAAISGGEAGAFLIQGWTGMVMPQWDPARVDHVEAIADEEAVEMTSRLAREEGIFAGISTGANVVGAHRLAERLGPDAVIVTLAVDTGFKYMSVSPYTNA